MCPLALIAFASMALAVDTTAPSWAAQAWLEVGEDQALYDHPATTEAEITRRWRQAQLHLRWPAAEDDVEVTGYRILRGQQVLATVDGDTHTWGALTERVGEPWSVVPIDAAGNEGTRLAGQLAVEPTPISLAGTTDDDGARLLLIGRLGRESAGEVTDSLLGPMSDEDLAQLDALFADTRGGAAASISAPPASSGPNTEIRVGRQDESAAVLERSFHWQATHPIVWMLEVDGRDLKLELAPEQQDDTPAWSLELHTWPEDSESLLSRQVVIDPLSEDSLGGCARDTDYRHTEGLWVEWGIDPRGGDPRAPCDQLHAQDRAHRRGRP